MDDNRNNRSESDRLTKLEGAVSGIGKQFVSLQEQQEKDTRILQDQQQRDIRQVNHRLDDIANKLDQTIDRGRITPTVLVSVAMLLLAAGSAIGTIFWLVINPINMAVTDHIHSDGHTEILMSDAVLEKDVEHLNKLTDTHSLEIDKIQQTMVYDSQRREEIARRSEATENWIKAREGKLEVLRERINNLINIVSVHTSDMNHPSGVYTELERLRGDVREEKARTRAIEQGHDD